MGWFSKATGITCDFAHGDVGRITDATKFQANLSNVVDYIPYVGAPLSDMINSIEIPESVTESKSGSVSNLSNTSTQKSGSSRSTFDISGFLGENKNLLLIAGGIIGVVVLVSLLKG